MKARVTQEHKTNYIIRDDEKEFQATVRGSFFQDGMFPKVGDYVEYTDISQGKAVIEKIYPRSSVVSRKSAHDDSTQVIVANVDLMFIVMGLDKDYNLSRLERYLLLAQQCKVDAVVILNKSDELNQEQLEQHIHDVRHVAGEVPVHAISAQEQEGVESILQYFNHGQTAVLLGSSGVGKSTITNLLLNEELQDVRGVREDDSRGRHTTTSRQLFSLAKGGFLIDTPGIRELSVQESSKQGEEELFTRFSALARQCKFSNCDHDKSAGCAIVAALDSGDVSQRQYDSYQKIIKEREFQESKMSSEQFAGYKEKKKKLYQGYEEQQKRKGTERSE